MSDINIDFMVKNDAKGFFGAFSKTGKNSAEILSNVRQKDRLLNPQKYKGNNKSIVNFLKRNGYHNIYGDDEVVKMIKDDDLDDSQIEEVEEELDIFKLKKKFKKGVSKDKKPKKEKNELKKYYHRTNSEAYKFHDVHRQKGHIKKEFRTPNCTKYLPSKELVWKRTLVPPKWDKMRGRLPLFGKDNTKYYLNHEHPLKHIGKVFIDMDKQTMRGDSTTYHDLRIITTKTFDNKNKKKVQKKKEKDEENSESIVESEYSGFNLTSPNMLMKYENNYVKGKQKRVQSAITSSTRPQTGHPKNLNTLTSNNSRQITNNSRQITNNSNSIIGRNLTTNSKNINNNANNLNSSLSEENNIEVYSVSSSELNDSYNRFKTVYQRQIKSKNWKSQNTKQNRRYSVKSVNTSEINKKMVNKINNKNNLKSKNNNKKIRPKSCKIYNRKLQINKNKIKGPDFDKTMSREYYENLRDHGASLIPFSLPNFKQVRERPLTMVVYERPKYKKNKSKSLAGITPDMYNDIYKYLECTNNHTKCVPPNFDKMKARPPVDDSPLPLYMKGTVSRGSCETVNEKSLKMNYFAEGKFLSSYTSFWPKKSFNKIVNLNLLRSDAFLTHLLNNREDFKNSNNYVVKSMKFYHKNYDDLIKEGMLTKFDNVTLKTIKPKIKAEFKNMDKFLEKFVNETNIS